LAGSGCWYNSLGEAVKNMVHMGALVEPKYELVRAYEDKYNQFKLLLAERKFIT
jgi:hypothetical protein